MTLRTRGEGLSPGWTARGETRGDGLVELVSFNLLSLPCKDWVCGGLRHWQSGSSQTGQHQAAAAFAHGEHLLPCSNYGPVGPDQPPLINRYA